MSLCSIGQAMGRVMEATPSSPIAVFLTREGRLDAIFANTVAGRAQVMAGHCLVGVYHNEMEHDDVYFALANALKTGLVQSGNKVAA